MSYRNGIYIAFAADGETDPTKSDIKYYNIIKGWHGMKDKNFKFINSHEKSSVCRDSSKDETIKKSLRERLDNSKVMLLLVGQTTKLDDDFVPYEIEYAIDTCELPIIVCYVEHKNKICDKIPQSLKSLWPSALKKRIDDEMVKTIHIPFKEKIIEEAINNYDLNNPPKYTITIYKKSVYEKHGIDKD